MQIEIYTPAQGEPLPPVKWNYEALKAELTKALENFRGLVYTEDTINQAKKDRASLNKLADAIDTRRKEMKARYLAPYQEFESQAKELTALVKMQADEIDAQVKAFDDARKSEKQEQIKDLYSFLMKDLTSLVPYEKIHNPKWLNVTVSMLAVEKEITEKAEGIRTALRSIDALGLPDDMAERVKSVYLERLDLASALAEKERIERERQALADYEAATKKAEETVERRKPDPINADCGQTYKVDFRVWATTEQLGALKAFLSDNGIKYGPVPNGGGM